MNKVAILILSIFLIGCSDKDNLESNRTIKSIFNEQEIEDLSIILDFFNQSVCVSENLGNEDVLNCYQVYFKRMEEAQKSGAIEINIPFDRQSSMYNQISDSTFNQIWSFGKKWKYNSTDTLKSIHFNQAGKYFKFLKTLGKKDDKIERYWKSYESAGSVSPSMIANLLMYHGKYDMEDVRYRLFVAIHYLTLNDEFKRKEKI